MAATFAIQNPHGLHARPAARMVSELRGLDATVRLTNRSTGVGPVPATSLSRVGTLGALRGHQVEVSASGPEARLAVDRLVALAADRFGEAGSDEADPSEDGSSTGPSLENREGTTGSASVAASGQARPGAPGVAVGPARHLVRPGGPNDDADDGDPDDPDLEGGEDDPAEDEGEPVGGADLAAEQDRLDDALRAVRAELEDLAGTDREGSGGIFAAHLALLDDDELLADVRRGIASGEPAHRAWSRILRAVARSWADLPDPYLRARAADVQAVRRQVLGALTGAAEPEPSGAGVLVARDLTPAQTVRLDPALIRGIVLAEGSATSHAAILARTRGIPLVLDAGPLVLSLAEGTMVALDGGTGELQLDPGPEVRAAFTARVEAASRHRAAELVSAGEPALTLDGVAIAVTANLGSVADAVAAATLGADGSGLVRTELLFLDRAEAPSRAEQVESYQAIATALAGRPITLRSLDIGGDKPAPYLRGPVESNPFLGVRGLRLGLRHPELLLDQLAAVCAVARRGSVKLMFPMVTVVDELLAARELLVQAAGPEGVPAELQVGIMVEVPSAALKLASFRPHLDFVSIGTNDLTQYAMAAERGHPGLADLSDPLDPGVLRLVAEVTRGAGDAVAVSVCGEAASDDLAVPLLLGLGVRELSVAPPAVPRTKALVRTLDRAECGRLATEALGLASASAVRDLVRSRVANLGET